MIALQDRAGLDVNLMLFALWLGVTGRSPLDHADLAAAERAVCDIRAEIIVPLRALRRRLKGIPDNDVQSLREGVKALELAAEKLAQVRLAGLAGPVDAEISAEACLALAEANLALYLGPLSFGSADSAGFNDLKPRLGVPTRRATATTIRVPLWISCG